MMLLFALTALAAALAMMTLVWVLSLIKRDAGIIDVFWGSGFVVVTWLYFFMGDGAAPRRYIVLGAVTLWGLRLSLYILKRNWGKPEDFRYQKWREEEGTRWWWFSFLKVFLLQGFLMWIVSAPLLAAQISPTPPQPTFLDFVAVPIWLIGFFFEAVGDWQMARFKANPANKGKVLNTGVWRYTRHPNYFMARIVVPGGVLTTSQVRGLSKIIEAYAQGRICLTTRQALQMHYLRLGDLAPMMRELAKYSLTTLHGCGDNIRNTAACPWASVCPHRRFDVLPYARKTAEFIGSCRDLDNLPRKFKVAVTGSASDRSAMRVHDIGVRLVRGIDGDIGFEIWVGGGLGRTPMIAQLLRGFLPREHLLGYLEAILRVYNVEGRRDNLYKSRIKILVSTLGIEKFRELVEAEWTQTSGPGLRLDAAGIAGGRARGSQ